ncbi:hypothetical protein [Planctomycetes bacterium Pla163]|uniref:hypothetical protein n=1 Tax=Rohdeia mirabilis TaxID=2528008 RepID=UPI0011A2D923
MNIALLVAIVIVVALGVVFDSPGPTRLGSGPVFEGLDTARVRSIEVARGDERLVLRAEPDAAERWTIDGLFGFAVAAGRVERNVLEQIANLSRADQAGSTRDGFDFDETVSVRLFDAGGVELVGFEQSISRRPPGGGSFLARLGEEAVYRSVTLPVLPAEPSQWWDGRLAPDFDGVAGRFDPAALEVELRTEDGPVRRRFERGDDGIWRRTDSGVADPGAANTIAVTPLTRTLQELSRLRLVDVVAAAPAPEHGLDDPTAVFTVRSGNPDGSGRTDLVVTIGASDGERLFARSTGLPGEVVVAIDPLALDAVIGALAPLLAD